MRKSHFTKHIQQLGEDELREELSMLYDKLKDVKLHYAMELGTEKDRIKKYEKVKADIKSKYATKSFRKPRRLRIQKIKKIISDVRKNAIFEFEMIDIYLFNAEEAVNFMNNYRFYSTPLFNSIVMSFKFAMDIIRSNNMLEEYRERCLNLIEQTKRDREIHKLLLAHYNE